MEYKQKLLPMLVTAAFINSCAYVQPKTKTDENPLRIESTIQVSGASAKAASMYQLGRYYQGQNRFEQAFGAYQKSLLADNKYTESYNGMGVIYSRQGKYDQAVTELTRALALSPQADHIHNNLGYAHYLKGDNVAAIESFEQALQLNPKNQRAAKNLALAQAKLGMPLELASQDNAVKPVNHSSMTSSEQQPAQINVIQRNAAAQDAGQVVPIAQPALQIKQIAPAVFELKRNEVATETTQSFSLDRVKIEVSNGNGILGMAKRVGAYLKQQGMTTIRLSNHRPFNVEKTQVHYRNGYQEQAQALQAKIPGEPTLVQRNDLRDGTQLRLLLGQDLATQPDSFS